MHSPRKKKNLYRNTHQTEHVQSDSHDMSFQEIQSGRIREVRIKQRFYTMHRTNPFGSTVSITSILYCIYRLILLLCV
ncbi:unnamed protein product, partial [Staurois parvus]